MVVNQYGKNKINTFFLHHPANATAETQKTLDKLNDYEKAHFAGGV